MDDNDYYLHLMSDAIHQNNEAVVQIVDFNFGSATGKLTNALEVCREITGDGGLVDLAEAAGFSPSHVLSMDECMKQSLDTLLIPPRGEPSFLPAPSSTRQEPLGIRSSSDLKLLAFQQDYEALGAQYVYEKPIFVPALHQQDIQSIGLYRFTLFLGCIATFNMSLALQLSAREATVQMEHDQQRQQLNGEGAGSSEENSGIVLRKAARLYEICLSFQEQRDDYGETGSCLFSLAVVNNLGIIHRQLQERQMADKCFEFVLSTLMFLTSECSANGVREALMEDLDGFFHNVSHVIQECQSAPAA